MSCYGSSRTTRLPDQPWSWLVCVIGTIAFTIFIGLAWSYSVFLATFMDRYDNSIEELSAIGSVLQCLIFLCVPITYKIVLHLNFRRSAMASVVICASSIFVTSFIEKNALYLFITYSIPYGMGCSLMYSSCIFATTKYFEKRQNLAIGILCTGYAIGLLTLVPLLQFFIDQFGLQTTLWIMCGTLSSFFLLVYIAFDTNIKDDRPIEETKEDQSTKKGLLEYREVFKRPAFVISIVVSHIQCGAGSVVSIYLVKYCIKSGLTGQQGANQFTVIGVMSLVSSILAGRIMDNKTVNPFHVNQAAAFIMATSLFLIQLATENYHFMIFSFFYGVGLGMFRTTVPVLFLNTVEPRLSKYSWPTGDFFASIGNGIGPPFIGFVIDVTRSYTKGFNATAVFVSFSFLLPFLQYCFKPWRNQDRKEIPPCRTELMEHFEEDRFQISEKEHLHSSSPEEFTFEKVSKKENNIGKSDDMDMEDIEYELITSI